MSDRCHSSSPGQAFGGNRDEDGVQPAVGEIEHGRLMAIMLGNGDRIACLEMFPQLGLPLGGAQVEQFAEGARRIDRPAGQAAGAKKGRFCRELAVGD